MSGVNEHRGRVNAEIDNLKTQAGQLRADLDKHEHMTATQRIQFENRLTALESRLVYVEKECVGKATKDRNTQYILHLLYLSVVSVVVYNLLGDGPVMDLFLRLIK